MDLEDRIKEVDWSHMTEGLRENEEVYMICPVRKATAEEKEFLETYKAEMKKRGFNAHYPATDTNQGADVGGYRICMDHCDEQERASQIHVYWNEGSSGSYVDLGSCLLMHRNEGKKIKLINRRHVEEVIKEHEQKGIMKSYEHVLLHLDSLARKR